MGPVNTFKSPAVVLGLIAVAIFCPAVAAQAAHTPWPADWTNWNDPALWCTVGNPCNDGQFNTSEGLGFGRVTYPYDIGKFEVTIAQWRQFLSAVAVHGDPYGLYDANMAAACGMVRTGAGTGGDPYVYTVGDANWNVRPVTYVSWGDAARFCNWLSHGQPTGDLAGTGAADANLTEDGSYALNAAHTDYALVAVTRRADARFAIPTEDEWYKAAYHKNDGASGNYWRCADCADSASSGLADPDPGQRANIDSTIGTYAHLTVAGEYENSASAYGTFDQAGNVWEWTGTPLYTTGYAVRGGAWSESRVQDAYSGYRDTYRYASRDYSAMGFRIVRLDSNANAGPTASAGASQTIVCPNFTATLNGTVSDDGLPNPPAAVSVTWTQISGTGAVTFADVGSLHSSVTLPAVGTYGLRLTVCDGLVSDSSDTTVISGLMTSPRFPGRRILAGPLTTVVWP
jgi:formylglycine-generating enzyme